MKERPIIRGHVIAGRLPPFRPELRQAIRDDRKTMTRRVVKGDFTDDCRFIRACGVWSIERGGEFIAEIKCPYGKPGDIRVLIEPLECVPDGNFALYKDDGAEVHDVFSRDPIAPLIWRWSKPWLSSIHMPYEAARTLALIKDIRVERLQDITKQDVLAEGIKTALPYYNGEHTTGCIYINGFANLWDSINAKKHPWADNPWVWVVEFERIKP